MISEFSKQIKDFIASGCPWLDRMPDLPVVIASKVVAEGQVMRFPLGLSAEGYKNTYDVAYINSKEKAVSFIEDWGTTVVAGSDPERLQLSTKIRVIGMVNLKKFGLMNSADLLMYRFINSIPKKLQEGIFYTKVEAELSGILSKSPAVFSRYNLDEGDRQMLIYPYDYFALEYDITYYVFTSCLPEITEETIC